MKQFKTKPTFINENTCKTLSDLECRKNNLLNLQRSKRSYWKKYQDNNPKGHENIIFQYVLDSNLKRILPKNDSAENC